MADGKTTTPQRPNSWCEMPIIQWDYCEPLRYQQASIDD